MKTVSLSSVSMNAFTNKKEVQKDTQKTPEQKKNGAKLLALGALVAATATIAGLLISNKHKQAQEVAKETVQEGILKLRDIKFSKGRAFLDNKEFSGSIVDTLKNGDAVEMVYKNGVLQKSSRKGSCDVLKEFLYDKKGNLEKINVKKPETTETIRFTYNFDNGVAYNGKLFNKMISKNDTTIRMDYYNNGKLHAVSVFDNKFISPFGGGPKISYRWYRDGQIASKKTPKKAEEWYEDGVKKLCINNDKSATMWFPNGVVKMTSAANGLDK